MLKSVLLLPIKLLTNFASTFGMLHVHDNEI